MNDIFTLHVELAEVSPPIWRRIEVRSSVNFWALHCAIQDAMGWNDSHLHEFLVSTNGNTARVGIPEDANPNDPTLPGWKVPLSRWLEVPGTVFDYLYDFGDDWLHQITLEGRAPAVAHSRYPRCTGGERSCPPEDVGGPHGYANFLEVISNPRHERYKEYIEWIGQGFDPERFRPQFVRFTSPKRRLARLGPQ